MMCAMITQIHIRNFAIVDQLELTLRPGMTVLTGETGAGKSILLDALDLALGSRADSGVVRHGTNRAEIAVDCDISRIKPAQNWLKDNDLDADGDCQIRRTVAKDGRSKGFINGSPVPMQSLRMLGELLVDIQGQHAHQSLLKRDMQRQAIDDFAAHHKLLAEVNALYQSLKLLREQQSSLLQSREEREARIELLTYQTQELDELSLEPGELPSLEQEQSSLAHASQIKENCERVIYTLRDAEEQSILQQINSSIAILEKLFQYDTNLEPYAQMLINSSIQVEEASSSLRHHLENLDMDPERLDWVDSRLGVIHDLSRKHHVHPSELINLHENLKSELSRLLADTDQSNTLDAQIETAQSAYIEKASKLTESRKKAARKLEIAVTKNIQKLGMPNGKFVVDIQTLEDIGAMGMERVEFLVTMNPGQPLKPLNKVASGGELSRISLAIHVITAASGRIPTLVFDEVDVGIGGGTAEIVGHMLRDLSKDRQVLCVTHQPQVAALGHQHLQVNKFASENSTNATVTELNDKQRTDEVARMLGGLKITEKTLSHAREMLKGSKSETA